MAGGTLLLLMLAQRLLSIRSPGSTSAEPSQSGLSVSPPWWITTEHWDARIKSLVVIGLFVCGLAFNSFFIRHSKPSHGLLLEL